MALTLKQEAFVHAYLETGNASEAYRRVYKPTGKATTVNRSATELLANPTVTARLGQLRAIASETAGVTLEEHLRVLAQLRKDAAGCGQYGPAITAEIARGKAAGLQVERSKHEHTVSIAVVDPYAEVKGG